MSIDQQPSPGDTPGTRSLRGWYAVGWVLLGPCPSVLAVLDDPGARKYWSLALLVVLTAAYAIVGLFPRNPVLRPSGYVWLLVVGLGVLAGLPGGGAALFLVTLPQFWIFAGSPRRAVVASGAAMVATVVGSIVSLAWSPDLGAGDLTGDTVTGNATAAVAGYAVSVLFGLWLHRFVKQSDQRSRRLSDELATAQLQLAEAHRRQGAADERDRIAREIHDTVAQGLASIVVLAQAARAGLYADSATAAQQLRSIEDTARENLAEARVLVGSGARGGVAAGSVGSTLRRTLDRFQADTGLTVEAELPDIDCDQPIRIALLRCTQESLANVRKHAGASTVGVVLARHADGVELEITDDGRGFVVGESRGFGLDGMRRRLAEFGGGLTVTSAVGEGTRILVTIPTDGQV